MKPATTTVPTAVHRWEAAGFGRAPFRFVGYEECKYQACQGAPIQPGTSCDVCGTGIMGVYWIQSADGRRFKVGCDCVRHTGDTRLIRTVDAKARELARAKAHARAEARAVAARTLMGELETTLRSMPHPYSWLAAKGLTALDYAAWNLTAGDSAKVRVHRFLMKLAAAKADSR